MTMPSARRNGNTMKARFLIATCLSVAAVGAVQAGPAKMPHRAAALPLSSAEFVREAALSDMFETQSSELAAIRGDAPARVFAAKMDEDHQKSSSELHMIIKPHWRATPFAAKLDAPHEAKMSVLRTLNGPAFTRQYRTDQVAAHQMAVAIFSQYASRGEDDALKAFAAKMLPTLKMHLQMAQAIPTPA